MKECKTLIGVALCLAVALSGAALAAPPSPPPFSATIDITGDLEIVVGQTTTLTATWSTNRDVTRSEWSVDGVGLGVIEMDGASAGSSTFTFTPTEAGTYQVCFEIWHHSDPRGNGYGVTNRWAEACVTITVTDPVEGEWYGETAWAAGTRYVERGNWATYTAYVPDSTVNLYAGQTMKAGEVHFSAASGGNVTITITLINDGWRFLDAPENVKIQGYASEPPEENPSPGLFEYKSYADPEDAQPLVFQIDVPENIFYGVQVDVEWQAD